MNRAGSPLVGLVTIWYDAADHMDRFVSDMQAIRYPRVQPVFLIYKQTRKEVERLRSCVPKALFIEPGSNLGTAVGWNLAIDRLTTMGAEYIGIWNADVKLHPKCLEQMVSAMQQDPTIGAVGPLLLYSDEPGKVEMYGGSFDVRTGMARHDYNGVINLTGLMPKRDAEYLDGGTMLLRAEVLRQVGGFDEEFFMYGEDCDISFRIRRAGYRTTAVRDAWAWHYHRENNGSLGAPHEIFYITRNQYYLVAKHGNDKDRRALAYRMARELPRRSAHYLRRGKPTLAVAYLTGIIYGLAGWMGKRLWVR